MTGARDTFGARAEAVVVPRSPLRLPRRTPDGVTQADEQRAMRLVHLDGRPAVLTAERGAGEAVRLRADAADQATADLALERLRFWTGVDDDLTAFLERFADDPLIGRSVTESPWRRPFRRPMPFEVLAGAVCEQLITDERAQAIKRAIVREHGPRHGELVDFPDAATLARVAPAELERCGLSAKRAITLLRVAREVAAGRVVLLDPEAVPVGWRRLRAIPGVGSWTVSMLALHGQGHVDVVPAGDHAYRMLVGALRHGRPGAKASEEEVVAFMERYRPWRGLAGWHALLSAGRSVRGEG